VVLMSAPDGRVDAHGGTLAKLNENAKALSQSIPLFPFTRHPTEDFNCCARQFGARRQGGRRKHAGVDLKFPPETPIRAIDDGRVVEAPALFYQGTLAFAVDHGWCVARYGEISSAAPAFRRVGALVRRGEIIAHVGQLNSGNSMLHLELCTGTGNGPFTVRERLPFQRRADLLDPMEFMRAAVLTDATEHLGNARVGHRVASLLNVRSEARLDAPILIKLPPGRYFDKRWHSPIETEGGPGGEAHIDQATSILRDKLEGVRRNIEGIAESTAMQTAVSRYNGGRGLLPPNSDVGTTGGDYMNDVWARARYYAEEEDWA